MLHDPDLISIQEVRGKVEQAYSAWTRYRNFSQSQVDALVESVAGAARANAQRLAELAVQETGYGNARDKLAKNMLAADLLPRKMRGMRTVGVLREVPEDGIVEFGEPMGVVAAILPTTNPTSTAIYKTLIALKAGNAIVLSPHPRARACSCETAAVLARAAEQAGAPQGLVGCIGTSTVEATEELMRHRRTAVILSTGGSGIVRAAYSSGKPAYGVGPGNVPVLVDPSADLADAVAKIVEGKSFDYGTLCSSEQTLVAERPLRDRILAELKARRAVLCDAGQSAALEKLLIGKNFGINPECVGQAAAKIAKMAGFEVPADTPILAAEIAGIGREHPLSAEKLSPVLSLFFVENFAAALDACEAVLRFGGLGHTCGIYAKDDDAHPRVCAAHAGVSCGGKHSDADGVHRNDHQCFSGDDAGVRRRGGEQHQRQHQPATLDQYQAARICTRGADGREHGSKHHCRGGGTISGASPVSRSSGGAGGPGRGTLSRTGVTFDWGGRGDYRRVCMRRRRSKGDP